ncbi:MAG: flavodoxin family protein [Thermoplasmata archaeon]|nr:flavodoxin family protein [Thermoplasmata archaeon]
MADVTAINASPRRNGNSPAIIDKMVETLKAEGKTVDVFNLRDVQGSGCVACYACKKTGKCVRKDGITPILESIAQSGSLLVAVPDYFGQPCSQYRVLEDRLYGFVGMNENGFFCNVPGKKVAVVVTSGSGVESDNVIESISKVMKVYMQADVVGTMHYQERPDGPFADNPKAIEEAVELAKKL